MAQEALDNVLASVNDARSNSNELAISLFDVAASLPKSTTELRRIAIEVTTFSHVLPHLEMTLQSKGTAKPTDSLIRVLVAVLKNANHVLHSIEEAVVAAAKADHDHEIGPAEHVDTVRPVLKSAQMTMFRLSLESLRLVLALITVILEWSGHCTKPEGDGIVKTSADQSEICAKCAVLSLRASIMQLQVVEKISLNETAARRLSEERERAEQVLRRIDRKPAKRPTSHPRHAKLHPIEPISASLEELIFGSVVEDLHSTQSWISQSTEHSLLLRNWTGIDLNPVQMSGDTKPVPEVSVSAAIITEPTPVADPLQPRRLTLFSKIRSHSGSHAKTDRGRLLSVQ